MLKSNHAYKRLQEFFHFVEVIVVLNVFTSGKQRFYKLY